MHFYCFLSAIKLIISTDPFDNSKSKHKFDNSDFIKTYIYLLSFVYLSFEVHNLQFYKKTYLRSIYLNNKRNTYQYVLLASNGFKKIYTDVFKFIKAILDSKNKNVSVIAIS